MTCVSCTNSITRAVSDIPGVSKVTVNLLDNSAMVVVDRDDLSKVVQEVIDDCGFECSIVSVQSLASDATKLKTEFRSVSVRVGGMFCQKCPRRILKAMQALDPQIEITRPLTYTDPIVTFSYVPKPPSFTIRTIISSLQAVSPQYDVAIWHPPTVEERSRVLQLRDQRSYLLRLGFTILAAIPTFIIGVVYMTLVKDGDATKAYLMRPLWAGNVSRAEWALFLLATPVMFGSASVFHRRSLKEIISLWRKGSRTPIWKRFVRFGSMNLLVSSGISVAYFSSVALLALAATQPPAKNGMGDSSTYFDAVVLLTMFLLAGNISLCRRCLATEYYLTRPIFGGI